MSLLVFGTTGQVAQALCQQQPDALYLGRNDVDLSHPNTCADAILEHRPTAVINAAAYTAVDRAETEPDLAHLINAKAPGAMAQAAKTLDIPFVHISTDYVFDGQGTRPWTPLDTPKPLGVYGRTKWAGEESILAAGGRIAILRTSWVFAATGANFVKTMLRLGKERSSLSVVSDQIGGPTPASDIAQACLSIAETIKTEPDKAGTYHFSGAPDVSWSDFARTIFDLAGITCTVSDIPSTAYPTPAPRPANSRLDCSTTTQTFELPRPDWHSGLAAVLQELQPL